MRMIQIKKCTTVLCALGFGLALSTTACSFFWGAKAKAAIDARVLASGKVVGTIKVKDKPKTRGIDFYLVKTKRGWVIEYAGNIEFGYDSAKLEGSQTNDVLAGFLQILQESPQLKLQIEGHTDSRGSDDYNQKLSKKRAESIREWLVKEGVDGGRLSAAGKGETNPKKPETSDCKDKKDGPAKCEEIWALNRRATLVVVEGIASLDLDKSTATGDGASEPVSDLPSCADVGCAQGSPIKPGDPKKADCKPGYHIEDDDGTGTSVSCYCDKLCVEKQGSDNSAKSNNDPTADKPPLDKTTCAKLCPQGLHSGSPDAKGNCRSGYHPEDPDGSARKLECFCDKQVECHSHFVNK